MRKKIILRILISPFGFLISILRIVNSSSRDLANKLLFPQCYIGADVWLTDDSVIGKGVYIEGQNIINHCSIGMYTKIHMRSRIENAKIGNYCSIAHDVLIGLGEHPLNGFTTSSHFYNNDTRITESGFDRFKEIEIGNDVWIGAGVIVRNGVKIGDGAVVAAGAVVTKNIEPLSIVGGVPAKLIKKRKITENVKLSESRWWEYDISKLKKMIQEKEICQ